MKNLIITVFTCLIINNGNAQTQFIVLRDSTDNNAKMLMGIIDKDDITGDSSFTSWYTESLRIYPHPDSAAVNALKNNKDKISFIIFGGTWCDDTHFILPKFYKIQEVAGFPENRITLFAVNRTKKTTGNIAQAMNITNVPTIIVMKDGKEVGRVVEYGKTGKWEEELAGIINRYPIN
jgi:thiol-disulfide isomerase/thioredoxin